MSEKAKAYILEIDDNGKLTGRHVWDNNCEILEVLNNGDALMVKCSFCSIPEIATRIPDSMDWGVVDGMRFNYRTWLNDDHMILINR